MGGTPPPFTEPPQNLMGVSVLSPDLLITARSVPVALIRLWCSGMWPAGKWSASTVGTRG